MQQHTSRCQTLQLKSELRNIRLLEVYGARAPVPIDGDANDYLVKYLTPLGVIMYSSPITMIA